MIGYDRPNTAVIAHGILLVGHFGIVRSVITEMIRLYVITNKIIRNVVKWINR
jgi:hypothetical protein